MKKWIFTFFLFGIFTGMAQNVIPDIDENSQNNALIDTSRNFAVMVENIDLDNEPFVSETYQIPAYGLYGQHWDTEHLRSKQFTIPFSDGKLRIILIEPHNSPFIFPCRGHVTLVYGPQRRGAFHPGIDFQLNLDDPVYASFDGVVRMAKQYGDYGKMVVVRHYNGLETVYAHLNHIYVKSGQVIKAGHVVGTAGKSGNANSVSLHFETRFLNEYFNPDLIFDVNDRTLNGNILALEPTDFNIKPIPQKPIKPEKVENPTLLVKEENSDIIEKVELPAREQSPPIFKPEEKKESDVKEPISSTQKPDYHVVQKGETLYRISVKYGVSVDELIRINKLSTNGTIYSGQKLKLR